MVRWLLILAVLLVAFVVLVVAIGAWLPQSHVASRRVRLTAPPDRVFALITDFAQTPTWRPDLTRVDLLPPQDGHAMFREQAGRDAIAYRVETLDAPRRLIVRIADPNLPFGGAWTYDLVATDAGGTHLTITEHGEVYNPVFRFMSRFVFSHHATIERYLRALGTKLGEPVTPEPVPGA